MDEQKGGSGEVHARRAVAGGHVCPAQGRRTETARAHHARFFICREGDAHSEAMGLVHNKGIPVSSLFWALLHAT